MLFYSKIPILKFSKISCCHNDKLKSFFEENIKRVIDSFCVSKIGRVESVKLSPNLKKIAYASFDLNKIIIFDIKIIKKNIYFEEVVFVDCDFFNEPHDFSWIDNKTIIVANRSGAAILFDVPKKSQNIKPKLIIHEAEKSNAVCFIKEDSKIKLFFCNVYHEIIQVDIDEKLEKIFKKIKLKNDLKVPDGLAINLSKNQIAIANALKNNIIIYDINKHDSFELHGSQRPHGLSFVLDRFLLSSGGGDQFINVWDLEQKKIIFKIKALEKNQYLLRGNDFEGGIKGIFYSSELNLLFLTCPNAPFLIFDFHLESLFGD